MKRLCRQKEAWTFGKEQGWCGKLNSNILLLLPPSYYIYTRVSSFQPSLNGLYFFYLIAKQQNLLMNLDRFYSSIKYII